MRKHCFEITYHNYLSNDYEILYNLLLDNNSILIFQDSGIDKNTRKLNIRIKKEIDKEYLHDYKIHSLDIAIKHFKVNETTFMNNKK